MQDFNSTTNDVEKPGSLTPLAMACGEQGLDETLATKLRILGSRASHRQTGSSKNSREHTFSVSMAVETLKIN